MPDAFDDALDAYDAAIDALRDRSTDALWDAKDAARQRVRALYDAARQERDDLMAIVIGDRVRKPSNPALRVEQGEVYEVVAPIMDGWPNRAVILPMEIYAPGDKVRVSRITEEPK